MKNLMLLSHTCKFIEPKCIKTILEIGARDGNDSNYLMEKFNLNPSDIYLVEPNYISIKNIKKKYPEFNLFECAINTFDGECDFYNITEEETIGISSVLNRTDNYYNTVPCEKTTVKCITGEELMKKIDKKIDYCQIDVEGMSYEVLITLGNHIKDINYILIESEYREVWKGQKLYKDIEEYLKKTHKMVFNMKSSIQSNSLWINKKLE